MASAVQQRFDNTLSRINSVLDAQVTRLEKIEAEQAAEREEARRQRQRANAEQRREIQSRYNSAFRSFGTEVPAPVDDEAPSAYRSRLFNRLGRKLSPDHELASIRADDLGNQPQVFDNFEEMIIAAAKAEGERPSQENLPPNGEIIARHRTDSDTGSKVTEFFGRESFIKDLTRPGRKVLRLIDPNSRTVIWGRPLDQSDVHPSPLDARSSIPERKQHGPRSSQSLVAGARRPLASAPRWNQSLVFEPRG